MSSAIGSISRFGSGGPYEASIGYSRVVRAGSWYVTAGCTSVVGGEIAFEGDAYRQALTAFGIGVDALAAAGCQRADIVQSRMYVTDRGHADAVGRAHHQVLGDVRPAATMVLVAGLLDSRMLVEIELTAYAEMTGPEPDEVLR